MAARKRKPNESFKKYRASLVKEERALKARLRGRVFYSPLHNNGVPFRYGR